VAPLLRSLRSTPIMALRCYYGRALTPAGAGSLDRRAGLPDSQHAVFLNHSVSKHLMCLRQRFSTLPLSVADILIGISGFAITWQARRHNRPKRVRHPTDWSFISCCFPPHLAAKQLRSITGWRAFCPTRTCTSLTACALRRTMPPHSGLTAEDSRTSVDTNGVKGL
jgi:hypothetical protein